MNERIEELMSIICEGENSIQREEVENYINNLQSKIDKANEILDKLEMQPAYLDCKYYELGGFDELRNALKEDK